MATKTELAHLLKVSRDMSEGLLAAFKTPAEWTHQLFPGANHALWVAGHTAAADNFFVGKFTPDKGADRPRYGELFGRNSTPVSDPGVYPAPDEVLAFMRERRAALLAALDLQSEADLAGPAPAGGPPFLTDVASAFTFVAWHEGLHAGQVSMIRRALGHRPVLSAPPAR